MQEMSQAVDDAIFAWRSSRLCTLAYSVSVYVCVFLCLCVFHGVRRNIGLHKLRQLVLL